VLIAGAGGAAHLPGVVAAKTLLPVLGSPSPLPPGGADALLSIVQMPRGSRWERWPSQVGAANAALLAVAILAGKRPELREKLRAWRKARAEEVIKADKSVSGFDAHGQALGRGQHGGPEAPALRELLLNLRSAARPSSPPQVDLAESKALSASPRAFAQVVGSPTRYAG